MCKNPVFLTRDQSRHEHFLFLASLLHTTIPKKNTFVRIHLKHNENKGAKRKRAKASQQQCISDASALEIVEIRTEASRFSHFPSLRWLPRSVSSTLSACHLPTAQNTKRYTPTRGLQEEKDNKLMVSLIQVCLHQTYLFEVESCPSANSSSPEHSSPVLEPPA